MSLRVLLSGAGSIARRHAANLHKMLPGVELRVVTRHPAERLADWTIPVTPVASFADGMRAAPDAVMICSVSACHAEELAASIRAGLPVFVEKPLLSSRVELEMLQALAPRAHPASLVGCNLRFLPSLRMLRQAIDAGVAGRLVRAHIEVGQWLPDWRPSRDVASTYSAEPGAGGGVVFDLVHEIDAATWLLGALALEAGINGRFSQLAIRTHDTSVSLLRAARGVPVALSLDYVSRVPVRRYVFVGEEGTLEWDMPKKTLTLACAEGLRMLSDDAADFAVADTYVAELREWLQAVRSNGAVTTSTLADAMPTARLMLAIAEQSP